MLKRIQIRKEHLFVAGVVLLLLIGYQLDFKKTIEAWQINRKMKEQQALGADLSYQPGYLKRKNANLDNEISRYRADTAAFRNSSIGTISIIAEKQGVKLSGVPVQDASFNTEKVIVQKLTFEGDFFAITKTLNDLQKTKDIGVIRSVTYHTSRMAGEKLIADLYLEILRE
ncbi:hypothetical protein [Mucilaginibacter sp. HD30]